MLQVTLGENTYKVEYVTALALREIKEPMAILKKLDRPAEDELGDFGRDLDILVTWFCLLFGNQFTLDDVYAQYPADRLLPDLTLAVMAVQQRVSAALSAFPTKAGGTTTEAHP